MEDLLNTEDVGRAIFAPDRNGIIFDKIPSLSRAPNPLSSVSDGRGSARIMYIASSRLGEPRDLFPQQQAAGYWIGELSPSGRYLAFYRLEGAKFRAGLFDFKTNRARLLPFEPGSRAMQARPLWISPTELIYAANPDGWDDSSPTGQAGLIRDVARRWSVTERGQESSSTVYVSGPLLDEESPEIPRGELIRVNAATGALDSIASGRFTNLRLSPDRRHLAAIRVMDRVDGRDFIPMTVQDRRGQLQVFDLASRKGPVDPCNGCNVYLETLGWSGDSATLAYVAETKAGSWRPEIFAFSPERGSNLSVDVGAINLACDATGRRNVQAAPVPLGKGKMLIFGHFLKAGESRELTAATCYAETQSSWFLVDRNRKPTKIADGLAVPLVATETETLLLSDGAVISAGPLPTEIIRLKGEGLARPYWKENIDKGFPQPAEEGNPTRIVLESARGVTLYETEKNRTSFFSYPKRVNDTDVKSEIVDISPRGDAALFVSRSSQGGAITRVSTDGRQTSLFEFNERFRYLVRPKQIVIDYSLEDGRSIKSCLSLPGTAKEGEQLPLIVYVYPGIGSGECRRNALLFSALNSDILTTHGYAVLFAATPYDISGDSQRPTARLPDLVLRATRAAVATGLVRSSAIGIWGYSQGMREALEVLTKSNIFRAGFVGAGMSDVASAYGSSTVRSRINLLDGPAPIVWRYEGAVGVPRGNTLGSRPWENPELFVQHSPAFYADRIQTPLLIINSDLDGMPIEQASEIFTALYRLHKPAQYVTYWGESHAPQSPANIRDFWRRILSWYAQHLKRAD